MNHQNVAVGMAAGALAGGVAAYSGSVVVGGLALAFANAATQALSGGDTINVGAIIISGLFGTVAAGASAGLQAAGVNAALSELAAGEAMIPVGLLADLLGNGIGLTMPSSLPPLPINWLPFAPPGFDPWQRQPIAVRLGGRQCHR
jgi:hypothetical protein